MKNAIFPLLVGGLVLWILGGSILFSNTFCGNNPNSTPEFKVIDGSFSYQADNTFYFTKNNSKPRIPSDTKVALKEVAQYLKKNPYRQLTLTGMYNISEMSKTSENLGEARAKSIKEKLIFFGAPRSNIKTESIKTNNSQFANNNLFGGVMFSFFEDPNAKTAVEIPGAVVPVDRIGDVMLNSEPTPEPQPEEIIEEPVYEEPVVVEQVEEDYFENDVEEETTYEDVVEEEVYEEPTTQVYESAPLSAQTMSTASLATDVIIEAFQDDGSQQMRPLNLYFPSNTYKLRLVPEMAAYFNELKTYLNQNPSMKIYLTGHSDSKGKVDWNMRVSKLRARGVKAFMEENGFPTNLIVIDYKGPNEPLADNSTEEGRLKNRRVEVRVHE